jgi:hypothetical protein
MNWRETVVGLRRLILLKLFRPRPPRPGGKEPSAAEIAVVIVEFIRQVDRLNGVFGKDAAVQFIKDHPGGSAFETTRALRFGPTELAFGLHFQPQVRPLAPDFEFDFEVSHEGKIRFSLLGDNRYEGFMLGGDLTSGAVDPHISWPTPPLQVSLWTSSGYLKNPVTRHAKLLRDVFVNDYGATDYRTMFGVK